jgi:hypothetical protein
VNQFLRAFSFADRESLANAEYAMNPDRPSAFVVSGPPMTGKSTLISMLLKRAFPEREETSRAEWYEHKSERAVKELLTDAALQGYLCIQWNRGFGKTSPELLYFLTAKTWTFRPVHTSRMVMVRLDCLTFIETCQEEISNELKRRVRQIRLISNESKRKARLVNTGGGK